MWMKYNENPEGHEIGDCVVRALSTAVGQDWETTYWELCALGALHYNWGSANVVWADFLRRRGWKRRFLPADCPDCYTVKDFCREYPTGTYILGIEGHVVAVIDGKYIDSWDSGECNPIYYWQKREET